MPTLVYQELNAMECLDVIRSTAVTRAAFTDGVRPFLAPMCFQLEAAGTQPVIHLWTMAEGRKAACLGHCSAVCLEFERPGCAWVDVVLLEGTADAGPDGDGLLLRVPAEALSGRRFFLPEE